jgi:hypothetical protein
MLKKLLPDWSFWMLLVFNMYTLYEYYQNPGEFKTLVFLYWAQSVVIGIANFFDILTILNVKPGSLKMNNQPLQNNASSKGCAAVFFLVHFGGFCLAHLIFLIIKIEGSIDFNLFKIGLGMICIGVVMDFVRKKAQQRHEVTNLGKTFFLPYLRVIPMHLMLILPEFIKVKNAVVFILLKILMDLVMHIATSGYYKKGIAPVSSVSE